MVEDKKISVKFGLAVWIGLSVIISFLAIPLLLIYFTDLDTTKLNAYGNVLRGLIPLFLGLVGGAFLFWRSHSADMDAKSKKQSVEIERRNQIMQIFAKGVENLGSKDEMVRLAAIFSFADIIRKTEDKELKRDIGELLYKFMIQHSRKAIALERKRKSHPLSQEKYTELTKEREEIKQYHSQFCAILQHIIKPLQKEEIFAIGLDYSPIYFWGIEAGSSDFSNLDITGANFDNANFENVKMSDANLTSVWFKETKLARCDCTNVILKDAVFERCTFEDVNFTKSCLLGAKILYNMDLRRVCFRGADLTNAELPNSDLTKVNFEEAILNATKLGGAKLKNANFSHANLSGVDLRDSILQETKFVNATVGGVLFNGANLMDTFFKGAYITNCMLNGAANIENARWKGAYYEPDNSGHQLFPPDFNPEEHGMIKKEGESNR